MRFTSNWVKNRWKTARESQAYYNKENNSNLGVKEFFKKTNPLLSTFVKYEVSFAMSITGEDYEFKIPQRVFNVYAKPSLETANKLKENTIASISKGFKGNGAGVVYNALLNDRDTYAKEVRGLEESKLTFEDLQNINLDTIKSESVYVESTPSYKVENSKHNTSLKYDLNLWID